MKQSLTGNWRLQGFYPYVDLYGHEMSVRAHMATDEMDATVPGGIHYDLYRAGWIDNPYIDKNSMKCEWTESRWWVYKTTFSLSGGTYQRRELVFDGLDYLAEVFLNGKSYGEHENMFTPMRIDLSGITCETVELAVVLKGVPRELGQYGRTSESATQKSRFGYKWDFATRLVNLGIWQDVYVEYTEIARVESADIRTDLTDGTHGIIEAAFSIAGEYRGDATVTLLSPEGKAVYSTVTPLKKTIKCKVEITNPSLWYPNGMGEHPLYTLTLQIGSDSYNYRVGIRRLRYRQNKNAPKNSLPYTIEINGKPLYVKGNNKVPLDHLYGNVSYEDYEWCVRALVCENCNLVRVWGGGIIETETFYDLCDRYGILIWQDFIQSSSEIDHIPGKRHAFLKKLSDAATHAVKTKRNHVSLALFTGGNELTDKNCIPATYRDKNIAMLRRIVKKHAPGYLFLPTTPSGPVYVTDFDREDNHDVHSPWEYDPKTHYERYNRLHLLFHSEFGISAMPRRTDRFLTEPRCAYEGHTTRAHHGGHWWNSHERDKDLYGPFDSVEAYAPYSQWTQAEGLRYVIETERRLAPYTSGSMVWQLNEPWPNADCTNLMDYFGNPKMAYYAIRQAFSKSDVSLQYTSLTVKDTLRATVTLHGDATSDGEPCRVSVYSLDGRVLFEKEWPTADLPITLECPVATETTLYLVRLSHRGIDKDYFFSTATTVPYAPMRQTPPAQLSTRMVRSVKKGALISAVTEVTNEGDTPAFFVYPYDQTGEYATLASDAYFTLLPGETRSVQLTLKKHCGLFFDHLNTLPSVAFGALNTR